MALTYSKDLKENLDFQIDLQFKRIINETRRCRGRILSGTGLTPAQCFIIEFLGVRPGARASQREIERHLLVQHPTVSGIIKRMEQKGLVRCVPNEKDRRVKDVILTEEAGQFKPMFYRCNKEVQHRMTCCLTEDDKRELSRLLSLVRESFEKAKDKEEESECSNN